MGQTSGEGRKALLCHKKLWESSQKLQRLSERKKLEERGKKKRASGAKKKKKKKKRESLITPLSRAKEILQPINGIDWETKIRGPENVTDSTRLAILHQKRVIG